MFKYNCTEFAVIDINRFKYLIKSDFASFDCHLGRHLEQRCCSPELFTAKVRCVISRLRQTLWYIETFVGDGFPILF